MKFSNGFLIIVYFISSMYISAEQKEKSVLILKNADNNRNSLVNGKLVSVLKGNVIFEYEDVTIYSNQAIWYRGSGEAKFSGNIRVSMKDQELTCKKMDLISNEKKIIANRNINFFDKKEQLRIIAENGSYKYDIKHLTLTGKPQLFRYDTTAAETLTISGRKMEYDDSLKTASVKENVIITKGVLESMCQAAEYNIETEKAKLRIDPLIYYDIHKLTGDSVDLLFENETLRGVYVMRNAFGSHHDVTRIDTIITEITGDSLYMALSDSGKVKNIWTHKDANAIYYSSDSPSTVNEANGKMMMLDFAYGKTGSLTISGNAQSVYYLDDEEKESGKNEASGDIIKIDFKNGKAVFIKITGDVRGTYFAEKF